MIMGISLKKANIDDCEKIHNIRFKAFFPLLEKYKDYDTNPAAKPLEHLVRNMQNESIDFYLILLNFPNGTVNAIGYIRIKQLDENKCDFSQIAVLPEYQGKGYAQEAINQIETVYPNCKSWKLDTIKQEDKLRHLYEKMEYKLTGEEYNIKDGMDIIMYEKYIY